MFGESRLDLLCAEHHAVDWVTKGDMADAAFATPECDLPPLNLCLPRRDRLSGLPAYILSTSAPMSGSA